MLDELHAIHIIAHGRVGEVSFGAGALSLECLADTLLICARSGRRSVPMASCCSGVVETAAGARGSASVAALDGPAEVRAAAGIIGSQPLGGGWQLDVSSGKEKAGAADRSGDRGLLRRRGPPNKGLAHRNYDG